MSSFVSNLEVQIRKEVEQVLRKHVRRLSGVTHELSNVFLSLDMLTLTTTVLLVERENEIAQALEEERYNDNSLLKSLSELGLNQEREIRRTLQIMEQKKYFDLLEGKDYHPLEVATKLTTHINEIFPQMPGLNLIVYFNQIIDEVLSNRKTVELAVAQIDKTLQTQGASKFKTKGKPKPKAKSKDAKAKSSLASMLKKSKRLSSLNRLKKMKTPPPKPIEQVEPVQPKESIEQKAARLVTDDLGNFVANDFDGAYAINPDEIGAGVTDPQALADMFVGSDDQKKKASTESDFEIEISQPDISVDADDNDKSEGIDSNAQSYADDLFQSFQAARSDESETEQQDQINDEVDVEPEEIGDEYEDDEEYEDEDVEDEDVEDENVEDEDVEDEEADADDDEAGDDDEDDEVKRQIDEMNESLRIKRGIRQKSQEALSCPLCHEETIVELETSSHKTYYSCNNDDCKFISWDKPIDQQCPQCENPFLIEVNIDGEPYYQCPNKNCDYKIKKADVTDETFLTQPQSSEPEVKKKRKKRVRKVRVRRK